METAIVVPLWASVLFRVVGSVNVFLSMDGLDAMLTDMSFWLANPNADLRYFRVAYYTMCAVNLFFIVMLCLTALDFLQLKLPSVRLYAWLVLALIAYYLLLALLWFLPNPIGISIASASGVGNMGIASFEFVLFLVPYGYPVVSVVALYIARSKVRSIQS